MDITLTPLRALPPFYFSLRLTHISIKFVFSQTNKPNDQKETKGSVNFHAFILVPTELAPVWVAGKTRITKSKLEILVSMAHASLSS